MLFECAAVEDVRALFWGKLGVADHDLSSLMDGVYQTE